MKLSKKKNNTLKNNTLKNNRIKKFNINLKKKIFKN
jgi:hypothetical protein